MNDLLEFMKLIKDPTEINALITSLIETFKPVAYHAGAEIMQVCRDYVNNEELYGLKAANKYKLFQAYQEAGFTEEQAMLLLLTEEHMAVVRAKNLMNSSSMGAKKAAEV